MKEVKLSTLFVACMLLLAFSACQEDSVTPEAPVAQSGINQKTIGDGGIDDLADQPSDQRVPYPTIISKTFIPDYDLWDDTKCLTWRIEWPEYDASVDQDKIATVFSINNGALNSFYYLNNVDPANTHNAQFSLYYDEKLENVAAMWMHLDYYDGAIETTKFAETDFSAKTIEGWVKERPDLFENHWPEGSNPTELEYGQGDIILFHNIDQDLYGGIRIVSMTPRIIEVYLAVPNI